MKNGKFETQQEVWRHLLDGGVVVSKVSGNEIGFKDGCLHSFIHNRKSGLAFSIPENFCPKPKEVTITRDELAKAWNKACEGMWNNAAENDNDFFKLAKELGL